MTRILSLDINNITVILFIIFVKYLLALLTFGGGDTNNFAFFYSLQHNNYDIYSIKSPYPYFPFANFINILIGKLADLTFLNFNIILKFNSILFDFFVGYNIYVYLLDQTNDQKLSFRIFIFYLINPITFYITCFLGFTDTMIIMLLLCACRINDFRLDNNFLIPIILTISLSIKPVCILFFPYFFFNTYNKFNFVIISFLTFIGLNSFYFFNFDNVQNFLFLIKYIFLKITYGHQVSFHGLGLIRHITEDVSFLQILIKILKYTGIFLILLINIYLPKKLRSIDFVLITFLIIFLFSDHVHLQYFSWIIPFLLLTKLEKKNIYFIINFSIIIIIYSLKWIEMGNYGLIIFPEGFNFLSNNLFLNEKIFSTLTPFLIFIYFFPLIIIFLDKIKILKSEIQIHKFSIFKVIQTLFRKNKFTDNFKFRNTSIIYLMVMFMVFLLNFQDLYDNNKKVYKQNSEINLLDQKNFKFPKSILNSFYGESVIFETTLNKENLKNGTLYLKGDYVYSIRVNNKIVFTSLGDSYSDNIGGENYLFSRDDLKIDFSKFYNDSNSLKLSIISRNYHPNKNNTIKYDLDDVNTKFDWDLTYKNNSLNYSEKIVNDRIFITSDYSIENRFLDNKSIFTMIHLLILFIFIIYFKKLIY